MGDDSEFPFRATFGTTANWCFVSGDVYVRGRHVAGFDQGDSGDADRLVVRLRAGETEVPAGKVEAVARFYETSLARWRGAEIPGYVASAGGG